MTQAIEAAIEETLRRLSADEQDIVRRRFALHGHGNTMCRRLSRRGTDESSTLLRALRKLRRLSGYSEHRDLGEELPRTR